MLSRPLVVAAAAAAAAAAVYYVRSRLQNASPCAAPEIIYAPAGPSAAAASLHASLQASAVLGDKGIAMALARAERVLTRALEEFKEAGLCVAFNGGKDATAALLLTAAAAAGKAWRHGSKSPRPEHFRGDAADDSGLPRLKAIYFWGKDEFPGMRDFVESVCHEYGVDLVVYHNVDFKAGLEDAIARFGFRGFVMGLRRGDPDAKWIPEGDAGAFAPSSDGWPDFVRVHPVIEWTYSEVWTLLKRYELPYFSLYDEGYTSLGNVKNTSPNPALKKEGGSYRPAHKLVVEDGTTERDGRR
jgi:FAD synthetase